MSLCPGLGTTQVDGGRVRQVGGWVHRWKNRWVMGREVPTLPGSP